MRNLYLNHFVSTMLRRDTGLLALLAVILKTHADSAIKRGDSHVALEPLQVARSVQHLPGPNALVRAIKAALASEADAHSDCWPCI